MANASTLKAKTGSLVANDRKADRYTRTLKVLDDARTAQIVPQKYIEDGFQLAEWPGTGMLMFIRVTETSRLVRNWSHFANDVKFFEVATVAHEDGSIWAEPGAARQFGLIRTDAIDRI